MKKDLEESLIFNNRNIITNNYYSQKLLENCGFPKNFFELIENFPSKDDLSRNDPKATLIQINFIGLMKMRFHPII